MSVQEREIPVFQFTLKAARISSGYSLEEATERCSISTGELEEFENDTTDMPICIAVKVSRLYGVPLDLIYAGSASECISHNREVAKLHEMRLRKEAIQMLKDDGMDQLLISMVSDRGDEVAHQKAEASEEYVRWDAEKGKAWQRLSESFTPEQRQAYIDYERAEASVQEITERYYYAQGLKDGIALSHIV